MERTVLGISTSPRAEGNTDLLLKESLRGAESVGAETEYLTLRGLRINPCVECNHCHTTGLCRIQDDFQHVFERVLAADRIVFASPVFFMAVTAQAKLLIDRCQCLWSRKYVLKEPMFGLGERDRRALVISVGGSRSRKMFECIGLTMKYYFDALETAYFANLFVNQVDERGAVLEHPSAMREAFHLGRALASFDGPMPDEPLDVALLGTAPPETSSVRLLCERRPEV